MKDNFKSRLTRLSGARRGVMAIASGSLIGQVILAASTPVLSRLYPPASFGVFSAVVAIASLVAPAATLRYESALLLPKAGDDARRLLRLGLVSAVVTSVATAFVVWVAEALGALNTLGELGGAPLWVGLATITTGIFALLSQAALREQNYSTVASRSIYQSAGIVAGQLLLSFVARGPVGLLGGYVFGRGIGYVALYRASKDLFARPQTGTYREVLRRYWRFPLVFTPSGLLNTLGSQLPLLIIAAWFGASSAGELGIAQRLVAIPATLIGASMGQVFAAEVSRRLRDRAGGERQLYLSASLRLAYVALPVTVALLLIAPWFLPLLLGQSWVSSGQFAQAMSISVGLGLVASPVSIIYYLFQRSRPSLIVDVSRVALIGAATGAAIVWHTDAIETTWLLYGAQSLNYVITWIYGLRIVSIADGAVESEDHDQHG